MVYTSVDRIFAEPVLQAAGKELGLDVEAVKTEARKPEVAAILEQNRVLGEKLGIQGTPTLVIGDEVILHAAEAGDIARRLK